MLISVVICSRDAQAAEWVVRNLRRTAARPDSLQILVMDNSVERQGICTVYNRASALCRGEVILFQHEDVYMMEAGWDNVIRAKFNSYDRMGILGVAGSSYLMPDPPLWSKAGPPWTFGKVVHELDAGREFFLTLLHPDDGDRQVVCLDGLWLVVRATVLQTVRFDADTFPGFHFYDADFCLQARRADWELWVTTDIRVKHLSPGNFGAEWQSAAQQFLKKWRSQLPASVVQDASWPSPGSQKIQSVNLQGKVPQWTLI